ncbi:MAG: hypothetical protein KDD14_26375, partial [Saprospiraceae bacterium]|nr:hypothetical protein [Saprospiraceae bacterium]
MASVKIVQKDKPLKSGLFPIYLRIIKDRKLKRISLGFSCRN